MPTVIDDSWYSRPESMKRERRSAGGVVVRREGGELLVILVREIEASGETLEGYVLPKGGIQKGESLEAGARREIQEEVGLTEVDWLAELEILERQSADKRYWSINHYALFRTEQAAGDILDKEHHFDPRWFPLAQLPPMFWPDEKRMIETHRDRIAKMF